MTSLQPWSVGPNRHAGRRRRWLLPVVLAGALAAAPAYMLFMPGSSYRDALPPWTEQERAAAERLRRDVVSLSDSIGERRLGHGRSLDAAAELLLAALVQACDDAPVRPRLEPLGAAGGGASNIVVELPARTTSQWIVVGAHYDSAPGSPGANDNASGVAALLELVRRFARQEHGLGLRFVLFANEEEPYFQTRGMGSFIHAAEAKRRGERIALMISLETLGYYTDRPGSQRYPWPLAALYPNTGDFIAFVANLASAPELRRALRTFRETTPFPSQGAALPEAMPGVGWSDHSAFWRHDYPALMITDTALFRDPHYHRPSDRSGTLDYERLARVVGGLERVLRELVRLS